MNKPTSLAHKPIKTLSPQLANQIAAGEVVERPASVVKELVENSLDAGATQIHIEIIQGGQKRILIRDNGKGIKKEELSLALSRHATSKIADIDDLENITSMGFRGEALASISSVSRLCLTSKTAEQSEAWQAQTEGQEMAVQITPAAHPNGTSIEVLDLFFNTPARRKFLRTGKTEFQHIENILKRLALTRKDVQFTLVHNQKTIFKYAVCIDLAKRIEQVCSKQMLENSVAVEYEFESIKLQGWCSALGHGHATRDHQYTFVNGRMMRDKLLSHALRQVFEDTLSPQMFPSYVLFVSVPPNELDINVHPAKHEVRFHQSRKVHDIVFKGVTEALGNSQETLVDDNGNSVASAPSHDYIQPLRSSTDVSKNEHQPSASVTRHNVGYRPANTYRPDTPSKQALQSTHDFYTSIAEQAPVNTPSNIPQGQHIQNAPAHSNNDSPESEQHEQLIHSHAYLMQYPYLLLQQEDGVGVLHIKHIAAAYLQHKIQHSTTSQPLLMPVSIADTNSHALLSDTTHNQLQTRFFLVTQSHQKLILK
ncbi:MAG: DNA mismatch repair endonuclease MutL, partial [Glaciecola sp.]